MLLQYISHDYNKHLNLNFFYNCAVFVIIEVYYNYNLNITILTIITITIISQLLIVTTLMIITKIKLVIVKIIHINHKYLLILNFRSLSMYSIQHSCNTEI